MVNSVGFMEYFSVKFAQLHLDLFDFPDNKFMGPTWGPPGSCRSQMGPIFVLWTFLSGFGCSDTVNVEANTSECISWVECTKISPEICLNFPWLKNKNIYLTPGISPRVVLFYWYIHKYIWRFIEIFLSLAPRVRRIYIQDQVLLSW